MSGGAFARFLCSKLGKNFYDFIIISAVVTAFGFAFAKLLYLLTAFSPADFFRVLFLMFRHPVKSGLMESGFVFYGGLIGGVLGYLVGIKIARCSFRDFLNIFAFVIPYIHAWGRVGCFCAGCCYGIPYEGALAVHYKNPVSDVPCGPGIFPVQLVEAVLLFVFAFCIFLPVLKNMERLYFPLYLLFYSVVRFGLEYLRYDKGRGFFWIFSTSQWISILIFIVVIILNVFQLRRTSK